MKDLGWTTLGNFSAQLRVDDNGDFYLILDEDTRTLPVYEIHMRADNIARLLEISNYKLAVRNREGDIIPFVGG